MQADWPGAAETVLRVDGGMAASDWTMQFLADILGAPVDRPKVLETTALGAAWLAGMRAGLYPDQAGFAARWKAESRFDPNMATIPRDTKYARWQRAVAAAMDV
jgi:glycerol kinase